VPGAWMKYIVRTICGILEIRSAEGKGDFAGCVCACKTAIPPCHWLPGFGSELLGGLNDCRE